MNKKIILIFIAVFFVFTFPLLKAFLTIEINMPDSFGLEEKISFDYVIISDVDETVHYSINSICPNAPIAFLQEKTIELKANIPFLDIYEGANITKDIESQECTASVVILEPIEQMVSKSFSIIAMPFFDFDVILNKKIFIKGEEINITYKSGIDNLFLSAILIYPDNSKKEITLPYFFEASKIGTYKLQVNVSKEGYKNILLTEQFGVIKEDANIGYSSFVDKDFLSQGKSSFRVVLFLFIGIIAVLILIVIIVMIIIYNKDKKKPKLNPNRNVPPEHRPGPKRPPGRPSVIHHGQIGRPVEKKVQNPNRKLPPAHRPGPKRAPGRPSI